MSVIKLKRLLPGMVLNADVLDHNNRILLNKRTTVSAKHIKTLKSWGLIGISTGELSTIMKIVDLQFNDAIEIFRGD